MKKQLVIQGDKASALIAKLCALTGENAETAVALALQERLRHVLDARSREAASNRAAILARAIGESGGPGIPVNHCWDSAERQPVEMS